MASIWGGLLIDTLAYRFLSSTSDYDNTGNGSLGALARDFFEYLSNEEKRERYLALGSNQYVRVKSPWFGRAAKHAYELCCDALDAEGSASENDLWREVFGRAFPRRKVGIMEVSLGLESHAADAAPWIDTEEFIEDKYPVDIRHSLNLDCTVTQDGFPPRSLREMLTRGFRLSARKSLLFRADLTEMEAEEPYTVMWKVLNVGDEARRRNMIRGQIVSDGGYCTKKETTDFRGDHVVECYVIKNEVVVARAQIEVPIN
ncbi:Uncharacterised protein [Escherichia coli]|nr:Uncharacterised protein [Escherichia coli]